MNKTQLQTNNTKLASLIETLQGKATGGGANTNSSAGQWTSLGTLPSTFSGPSGPSGDEDIGIPGTQTTTVYLEVDTNVCAILFTDFTGGILWGLCAAYWEGISSSFATIGSLATLSITEITEGGTKILQLDVDTAETNIENIYALQIYKI